ncbi:hypothetical protein [Sphingobacterium sp. ML3W]
MFFVDDFASFGTPNNVRKVLCLLEKDNSLVALA